MGPYDLAAVVAFCLTVAFIAVLIFVYCWYNRR